MPETKTISYRLGEQTYKVIKYSVVQSSDQYDSLQEFSQAAVGNNVHTLLSIAAGGNQCRHLIALLNDIRGITEKGPKDTSEASIKGESLSEVSQSFELPVDKAGAISIVQDETGLNCSAVIRRCLYRQLHQICRKSEQLNEWEEECITRTWTELKNGLVTPQHRFHEILTRRFVHQYEHTVRMIELDPTPFSHFAEEYVTRFHETDCYEMLTEVYGRDTFGYVENTIEEHTGYRVEKETSDFLDDLLPET